MPTWLPYLLPLLPIAIRTKLLLRFSALMRDILPEAELERETHRSIVLALAGFSFAGLLGILALGSETAASNPEAVYFLLISFLCYLVAFNLQGYKARRWHDLVGDVLVETASLGLLGAVATYVVRSEAVPEFKWLTCILAAVAWGVDFGIRMSGQTEYLTALEELRMNEHRKISPAVQQPDMGDLTSQRMTTMPLCATHNLRYPSGGTCPKCTADKDREKR